MSVFEIKVPDTQKKVQLDGCACLCGYMSGGGGGSSKLEP